MMQQNIMDEYECALEQVNKKIYLANSVNNLAIQDRTQQQLYAQKIELMSNQLERLADRTEEMSKVSKVQKQQIEDYRNLIDLQKQLGQVKGGNQNSLNVLKNQIQHSLNNMCQFQANMKDFFAVKKSDYVLISDPSDADRKHFYNELSLKKHTGIQLQNELTELETQLKQQQRLNLDLNQKIASSQLVKMDLQQQITLLDNLIKVKRTDYEQRFNDEQLIKLQGQQSQLNRNPTYNPTEQTVRQRLNTLEKRTLELQRIFEQSNELYQQAAKQRNLSKSTPQPIRQLLINYLQEIQNKIPAQDNYDISFRNAFLQKLKVNRQHIQRLVHGLNLEDSMLREDDV